MKNSFFKNIISFVLSISIILSLCPLIASAAGNTQGIVNNNSVRVRTSPTTKENNILTYENQQVKLYENHQVNVIEKVKSKNDGNNPYWYHISFLYNGANLSGYIAAQFVDIVESALESQGISKNEIYKPFIERLQKEHPNWNFYVYDTGYNWEHLFGGEAQGKVGTSLIPGNSTPLSQRSLKKGCYDYVTDEWYAQDGTSWYQANEQTIAYYMDPRNFLNEDNVFMFENLSYNPSYHTLGGVEKILENSFMENAYIMNNSGQYVTYAQAYMDAAKYSNVSPYHLAARTIQEVGKQGSRSVSGDVAGYEGLYNFYNIGATSSKDPVLKGLDYARNGYRCDKEKCMIPWNSPYKAILGGAYWISTKYINSKYHQNTLYYQKFNTSSKEYNAFNHQYMTNIMAPKSESKRIMNLYKNVGSIDNSFTFVIPYYRNMPLQTSTLPKSDNNNYNNYLRNVYVNGNYVSDFNMYRNGIYTVYVPYNTLSVNISGTPCSSKSNLTGTGTLNLYGDVTSCNITVTSQGGTQRTYYFNVVKIGNWIQNSWIKYESGWWYRHNDGSCTYNGFEYINNNWYYFNEYGYMVTDWKWINGRWYYFDDSGAMVTGWKKFRNNKYYYFYGSGSMATGWVNLDDTYYYFNNDGTRIDSGWHWIDNNCYYFYRNGSMARNTIIDGSYIGSSGAWRTGKWYKNSYGYWYCHSDGLCTTNDFEVIDGVRYYFDNDGYMADGWEIINGEYYYFKSNGDMATGWIYVDGNYYYLRPNGTMIADKWEWIDGQCYYFYSWGGMACNTIIQGSYVGSDGAWRTGQWYKNSNGYWYSHTDGICTTNNFEFIDGVWYYFDNSGYMATGWRCVNGTWYYFNSNGSMHTGWLYKDGICYYLNSNGTMATGWNYIDGIWYYFNNIGYMSTGWKNIDGTYYYFNSNGSMYTGWLYKNGTYYYLKSNGVMATDWNYINGYWYYFDVSGAMNIGWKYLNGKYYYFTEWGNMVTGWAFINGYYYYLNSSGDMATGWKYVNGDYYYMNSSGVMLSNTWCWIDGYCYYFYSWGGMAHDTYIDGSYVNSYGIWIA